MVIYSLIKVNSLWSTAEWLDRRGFNNLPSEYFEGCVITLFSGFSRVYCEMFIANSLYPSGFTFVLWWSRVLRVPYYLAIYPHVGISYALD